MICKVFVLHDICFRVFHKALHMSIQMKTMLPFNHKKNIYQCLRTMRCWIPNSFNVLQHIHQVLWSLCCNALYTRTFNCQHYSPMYCCWICKHYTNGPTRVWMIYSSNYCICLIIYCDWYIYIWYYLWPSFVIGCCIKKLFYLTIIAPQYIEKRSMHFIIQNFLYMLFMLAKKIVFFIGKNLQIWKCVRNVASRDIIAVKAKLMCHIRYNFNILIGVEIALWLSWTLSLLKHKFFLFLKVTKGIYFYQYFNFNFNM